MVLRTRPLLITFRVPLYLSGFPIEINGETQQCRVLALACTMDLPAMSAVKEVGFFIYLFIYFFFFTFVSFKYSFT